MRLVISVLIGVSLASGLRPLETKGQVAESAVTGCLAAEAWARHELERLQLSPGITTGVAVRSEPIRGLQAPQSNTVTLFSPDQQRGVMFFFGPNENGRIVLELNAYRLVKSRNGWAASEGNGGIATYRAIADYVTALSNRDAIKAVRLAPASACDTRIFNNR